jgi:hypothetical protein
MKFTIDTKFNIGDKVYAADHYHDYYASHVPYVISDVIINIDNRDIRIMYCVELGEQTDRFPEEWLFATYEECAKWCEEHN